MERRASSSLMYVASIRPALSSSSKNFCRALNNANSALWVNVAFNSYLSLVMVIELVEDVLCLKTFSAILTFFSSSSCLVMLVSFLKEACCMIWPGFPNYASGGCRRQVSFLIKVNLGS